MTALDSMRGLSLTTLRRWSLTWTLAMLALVATLEGDMPKPSRCSPYPQVLSTKAASECICRPLQTCSAPSPTPTRTE